MLIINYAMYARANRYGAKNVSVNSTDTLCDSSDSWFACAYCSKGVKSDRRRAHKSMTLPLHVAENKDFM